MRNRYQLWMGLMVAMGLLMVLAVWETRATPDAGRVLAAPAGAAVKPPPPPHPGPTAPPAPPLAAVDAPRGSRPAAPLRSGGPDAFGYLVSDSSEPHGPGYNYIPAGHLTDLVGDDVTKTLNLPFPVSIYDRSVTTMTASTNGLLFLAQGACDATNCYDNQPLPNTAAPPGIIAPLWDDLVMTNTNGAGVYTDVLGTTPARSFIIEWRNAEFYTQTTSLATFEVILHENSNQIDFEYSTLTGAYSNGSSATVGIQSYDQATGTQYSFNEGTLSPGLAIRFLALLTPGDQQGNTAGCASVTYTGWVLNPSTVPVSYQLTVSDSNTMFSSTVAPAAAGPIAPGASVPFTVTVNTPPGAPVGTTDVTSLTATSTTPSFPLTESVHLTTSTGAAFQPAAVSGTGTAGGTLTYTTSLYNRTGVTTTFQLVAGSNTWPSDVVPSNTGPLPPAAAISVTVHVMIPSTSQTGESDTVVVTATTGITGTCGFYGTAQFTTFNGNQISRSRLPQPRARHALVDFPLNGRAYLLGGVTGNNFMDLPIEEYDARADTWTARRLLPQDVSNIGAAVLGDTIYVPGGFDGANATSLVQTYQPATDNATILTSDPLPAPRYGAGVVALGGMLYVIGGSDNVTSTATVFQFNPAAAPGSRWTRKADLPTPRSFLAVAALGGRIYAVGGITNVNRPVDLATVEIYDPAGDTWSTGASLLTPRGAPAAVGQEAGTPCGGYLYVFGGGWFTPLASAERYNPATGTWAAIAPLSVARRTLAATYVTNGHLLLVAGGFNLDDLPTVDAVTCGGILPTPTATPIGGVPTFTPTPTITPCAIAFSDVQTTDYFYTPVRNLVCAGALSGYADATFRPYANMTRAQLCKVVSLSEGWVLQNPLQPDFTDVPAGNPFYRYIETAYSYGVVSGYADGTFGWGNNVTRSQIAKIVVLAQGWALENPDQGHFSDVPPGSAFFPYVETAYSHNILSGYADGTFRPFASATRGQVSKIVYNAEGGQ